VTQEAVYSYLSAAKIQRNQFAFAQKVLSVNINTHHRSAWFNALDNKGF